MLLCQFLYPGWSFFDIVCGVAGILVAVFAGTDHFGDFSRGGRLFGRRFSHRGRILSSFGDYRSIRDICGLVRNGIFGLRILRFWCWYRLWLRFRGNFRFLEITLELCVQKYGKEVALRHTYYLLLLLVTAFGQGWHSISICLHGLWPGTAILL